jgi:hypothetical protein
MAVEERWACPEPARMERAFTRMQRYGTSVQRGTRRSRGKIVEFVQNRYLTDSYNLAYTLGSYEKVIEQIVYVGCSLQPPP